MTRSVCSLSSDLQTLPLVLEEDAEHLRDDKDHLAVGNIQEECFPHPLSPFLKALGMAGGAESASAAGKVEEEFRTAVGTPDAGKSAAGVDAIEVVLNESLIMALNNGFKADILGP